MPHSPIKLTEIEYRPYAECADCEARWAMGSQSRPAAKDHVRFTGHNVRVIIQKVALWGPR